MGELVYLRDRNYLVYLRNLGYLPLPPLVTTVPLCEDPEVSTVCTCAGMLAYVAGRWQHVDLCPECLEPENRPCRDRARHAACPDPDPVVCCHGGCTEPVQAEGECANGRDPRACCLCCWVRTDILEGRLMWPAMPAPRTHE